MNKVLLIDDEATIRKLAGFYLEQRFEYLEAADGEEGFLAMLEHKPDIVVSDIMMPKMDGYNLRRRVLASENLRKTPFIFLTAKSLSADILTAYEQLVDDYIVKPFDPQLLCDKVEAILRRERLRKTLRGDVRAASGFLLPAPDAAIPGYEVGYQLLPADEGGGDFIDILDIDRSHTLVVMGDVMGHGLNAALYAGAYAAYVRAAVRMLKDECRPGRIMTELNRIFSRDQRLSEIFLALSLTLLDADSGRVIFANAGQPYPLLLKNGGARPVRAPGPPLGVAPEASFREAKFELYEGEMLLLFSDGVVDASGGESGEEKRTLGYEGLAAMLPERNDVELRGLAPRILENASGFAGGSARDDMSVMAIRKTFGGKR